MSAAATLAPAFPQCIGAVARQLWGQPNKGQSSATELRFGSRGSKSADIVKNTWFDHERGVGGGVLELVMLEMKVDKAGAVRWLEQNKHIPPKDSKPEKPAVATPRKMVTTYPYHDQFGELLFEVCRYEPKDFRQRRPDGRGGWIYNIDGIPQVPFRLPDLLDGIRRGATVFLCEGEKDTLAVAALGLVATTIRGGANKWHADLAQYFDGAHVVILPHNDLPGTTHAAKITTELAGVAATIRTIKLPGLTHTGADAFDWIEAGGTAEALQALVDAVEIPDHPEEPPPPNSEYDYGETGPAPDDDEPTAKATDTEFALPIVFFGAVRPRLDAADFVEGLLTTGGMSVIYGQSNSGKTFFMSDLGLHIACGWKWGAATDKRVTEAGGVIWLALEGSFGIFNRIAAFKKHYRLEGAQIPFAIIPVSLNLLDPAADTEKLIQTIKQVAAHLGVPVRLVVVDTLARAIAGGNENASEDMGALVTNGTRIQQVTNAAVAWIHHCGKDEAKGARGHSSLRAATDTEIEVTATDSGARMASVKKQRDMPCEGNFAFTLKSVELGLNQRGKPVTSCIVDHGQGDEPAAMPAIQRLSGDCQRALQILHDLLATSGTTGAAGVPDGHSAVPEIRWREKFYERAKPGAANEAKQRAFRRAADTLIERSLVGMATGKVWVPRPKFG